MSEVREVMCRSILSESKISDLTLNPYKGCSNGCKYCYVRFMKRREAEAPISTGLVEAKINAPTVLLKQIKRMKAARKVMMSSVCDAWQEAEEKYKLSRKCLEILLDFGFRVSILTKRALVMRDFDLIEKAKGVSLGVTITTFDRKAAALIEPGASPPQERALIFEEARNRHIHTFLFFGPMLPFFSDREDNIKEIFRLAREQGIGSVCVDKLNYGPTVWTNIKDVILQNYPDIFDAYRRLLFDKYAKRRYLDGVRWRIARLRRASGYRGRVHILF